MVMSLQVPEKAPYFFTFALIWHCRKAGEWLRLNLCSYFTGCLSSLTLLPLRLVQKQCYLKVCIGTPSFSTIRSVTLNPYWATSSLDVYCKMILSHVRSIHFIILWDPYCSHPSTCFLVVDLPVWVSSRFVFKHSNLFCIVTDKTGWRV